MMNSNRQEKPVFDKVGLSRHDRLRSLWENADWSELCSREPGQRETLLPQILV